MEYVTLSNGVKMPQLGYGVYQVTQDECERCVLDALRVGYRSLDTAQAYYNEEQVGNAIKKSCVAREEIFLTTKVWLEHYGEEETYKSVIASMEKLQTDYLDLVLLHQPFGDAYGAWRALEKFYEEGKVRAIGISNFYADRMVEFCNFNRIRPMVNQVETHPHNQQKEAMKWMEKYGVQIEAWAPLGEGRGGLLEDPVLTAIGEKYGKSPAQVMLRWNLQRGVVVIPKSTHTERMKENINVFDFVLNDEDMAGISALDKAQSSFFSHQDPAMVEWFSNMAKEVYKDAGEEHGGFFGQGEPNDTYAQYFIGKSYLKPLTDPKETVFIANVTFEPGCRNNWHIHHAAEGGGQILICVDGEGWYQEEGKAAQSLKPGDVVTIPSGVKHWHGAKKNNWFSHLAVECPGTGCRNEWCEPVDDDWYGKL